MGIPCDGTGINCYGMGQIKMSHGQPCRSLRRLRSHFIPSSPQR